MSKIARIMQQATAGAGGAGLDIDGAFSTYLYDGTGSAQTITNGIDLSGEGGLVWIKSRTATRHHSLFDTERGTGTGGRLSITSSAASTASNYLNSFNSNGFTIGTDTTVNNSGEDIVSWTFRKAPKFFDVVTFTGTGSAQNISHNLGSVPGMIIVKSTNAFGDWGVYHRGVNGGTNPENYRLKLESTTTQAATNTFWNDTAPTDSVFTVGTNSAVNASGVTYVAYLFAHHNSDGDFGPDSDQDVIKCGSFSTPSSGSVTVDLGFEPQWLLVKSTNQAYSWEIYDVMRGLTVNGHKILTAQTSNAEGSNTNAGHTQPTSTGFSTTTDYWGTNVNFIYMAIRRGPLAQPENATDVFDVNTYTATGSAGNKQTTGFPVDVSIIGARGGASWNHGVVSRLTGGDNYLSTNSTAAEIASGAGNGINLDDMTGYDFDGAPFNNNSGGMYNLNWKRAPSYFDVVTYTGTGSARTVSHNLGAVPEMMWIKARNHPDNEDWIVYHKDVGATKYLMLNKTNAETTNSTRFNDTAPTASVFTVGTDASVNRSGYNHIAYLFATLAGVSKVGSYTGDGNTGKQIDCGFSSGARFVLIKASSGTSPWYLWDSARGIVTGNDPYLLLNATDAEVTSGDNVDPYSAGFIVNGPGNNASGVTYIFYAIA